jgi:steroid C-25 hydroxylase gamma subunit
MKVNKSDGVTTELLNPGSDLWANLAGETVALHPIPLESQPNQYIRTKWKDRVYGTTKTATASGITNGDELFMRLEWQDDERPNEEFADAAAVITGSGAVETLGTDGQSVNLWYWAHDRDESISVNASGPGVFRKNTDRDIGAQAHLSDGTWSLVLSGPLGDVVDDQIGFAIWNGSNDERAGLAAVSAWLPLERE